MAALFLVASQSSVAIDRAVLYDAEGGNVSPTKIMTAVTLRKQFLSRQADDIILRNFNVYDIIYRLLINTITEIAIII